MLREMGTVIILGFVLLSIAFGVLMRLDTIYMEHEIKEAQCAKDLPNNGMEDEEQDSTEAISR